MKKRLERKLTTDKIRGEEKEEREKWMGRREKRTEGKQRS